MDTNADAATSAAARADTDTDYVCSFLRLRRRLRLRAGWLAGLRRNLVTLAARAKPLLFTAISRGAAS